MKQIRAALIRDVRQRLDRHMEKSVDIMPTRVVLRNRGLLRLSST